jgi:tyrosinase
MVNFRIGGHALAPRLSIMSEPEVISLIPLVGIPGEVKNRLDIMDFVKDEKFLTLYCRALQIIEDRDQSDFSSFFQLTGIHGVPFIEWAKAKPSQLHPYRGNYCTHANVLFPTWHRAYESIWEQILWETCATVAEKFTTPDKEEWKQAARDIRQPYWDWGYWPNDPDYVSLPPECITMEELEIIDFDGKKVKIVNPMMRYKFHPIDPSFEGDFANWEYSIRYPDANKKENIQGMIEGLKSTAPGLREWTFNMLTKNYTWELFSYTGASSHSHANSLEMVHNTVHFMIGKDPTLDPPILGHMASIPHGAFDPIFWMHHCNCDRMFAIWQALNYDNYVSEGMCREATMNYLPGQVLTKDTPLEPFYTKNQDAWQSDDLENWEVLGFSYPDFDAVKGKSKEVRRRYINDLVRERYGFVTNQTDNPALDLLSHFQTAPSDHDSHVALYDWVIHATFSYYELDDSFSIVFYFDEGKGMARNNIIGSVDAFRGTTAKTCANCASNQEHVAEGFVHLNYYIGRDLGKKAKTRDQAVAIYEPDSVRKYLTEKKISCKVVTVKGKLDSLDIEIKGAPYYLPAGEARPMLDKEKPIVHYTDLVTRVQ